MKPDESKYHYEYRTLPVHIVAENIDEYIIPECQQACKNLWDKNIFTLSCSNRNEQRHDGKEIKYIILGHLSAQNQLTFERLAESRPQNYKTIQFDSSKVHAIAINSTGESNERDNDSQVLTSLTIPFEMQDVLDGFETLEQAYTSRIALYNNPQAVTKLTKAEIIEALTKFLSAFDQLELLDTQKGVVFSDPFYKRAHQRYLEYTESKEKDPLEL